MIKPETGPGADRQVNFPFLWLIGLRSLIIRPRERRAGANVDSASGVSPETAGLAQLATCRNRI
jgi:hypothetical protein